MRAPSRQKIAAVFGRVLRRKRLARGLSQRELAAMANMELSYVSVLERGVRPPTLTLLFALANALQVEAALIVRETSVGLRGSER